MYYIVFESGSRAGLSAEIFFRAWRSQLGLADNVDGDDTLLLADADQSYCSVPSKCRNVCRVSELYGLTSLESLDNIVVFPADELSRQFKDEVMEKASQNPVSFVDALWYDKAHINNVLSELVDLEQCAIRIPLTFGLSDAVLLKPCKASAGSKGIVSFNDVCVSQRIDIKHEYVVDVLRTENEIQVFPREVCLRSGYDKMIKLIDPSGELANEVRRFIEIVSPKFPMFAPGIFHIQLAKDVNGDLYYIEASRRISGTSLVNLPNGFNPFCFINGTKGKSIDHPFKYGKWFRYEDFLLEIENLIKKIR